MRDCGRSTMPKRGSRASRTTSWRCSPVTSESSSRDCWPRRSTELHLSHDRQAHLSELRSGFMTMSPALAAETLIAGAFLAWAVSPLSSAAVGDPRCGNDLLPAALLLTRPAGQQTNQSFRMLGHGGQFVVAITDRGNVEHPFGSRPQLTDGLGPAQDQGCQQAVPRCVESIGLIQHVAVALHGATV